LAIGAIAGVFCFLMVTHVKARFGYDDSLDAFGVHGAGGMAGALLTGVFASSAINPIFKDASGRVLASGALEGNKHQLVNQAIGVAIAAGLAIVGTLVILKLVDLLIGLRVPEDHEIQGLDVTQHGEEGYSWEHPAPVRVAAFSDLGQHAIDIRPKLDHNDFAFAGEVSECD
jgi:Amt family ammonium transporter